MPVQECTKDGKKGWKWGKQGKCYTGPNGKQQAADQGAAIHAGDKKKLAELVEKIQTLFGDKDD